ncbi:MAG: hypothetical protein Kow0047_01520 [Anaerolineae bacterium]
MSADMPRGDLRPPQWLSYVAAYIAWALLSAAMIVTAMGVRLAYVTWLSISGWHRYTVNAVDKVATVLLAVATLVFVVYAEYFLRRSVPRRRLTRSSLTLASLELAILAVAHLARIPALGIPSPEGRTALLLAAMEAGAAALLIALLRLPRTRC